MLAHKLSSAKKKNEMLKKGPIEQNSVCHLQRFAHHKLLTFDMFMMFPVSNIGKM